MMVSRASPLLRMISAKSRWSCVELGIQQQAAHADDGVHGGADLVAHHGQEGALGGIGGLGFLFGFLQFHLSLLALGDIADGFNGTDDIALRVMQGRSGGKQVSSTTFRLGV